MPNYRAVNRIHLPPPVEGHLEIGEVVSFDGKTLARENGNVLNIPFASSIEAAIRVGWLVPEGSAETSYRPKPGGVKVHAAQSSTDKRVEVETMTVQDEERNLGSREDVRREGGYSNAKRASADSDDAGGVVVGRFKNPAKAEAVEIGKGDERLKASLENKSSVEVERYGRPVSKVASEGISGLEATFSGVSGGVGGEDDGVLVARFEEAESDNFPEGREPLEKALRTWAYQNKTWNGKPVNLTELRSMSKSVLEELDATRAAVKALEAKVSRLSELAKPAPEPPISETAPKPNSKKAEAKIEWSLKPHWKTREAEAMKRYWDDANALAQILDVENSEALKRAISNRLAELEASR